MPQTKTIDTGLQYRALRLDSDNIDADNRTVAVSFSSEYPVERWFGSEILDHSPDSVRVGRLQSGAAVLIDHERANHVGVVDSFSFDRDRVGRAVLRFSNSALAEEKFNDVKDDVLRHVSVGYRIHKMNLEETGDDGDHYRAVDWEPYEISFVSVPADPSVGVGRSDNTPTYSTEIIMPEQTTAAAPEQRTAPVAAAPAAPVIEASGPTIEQIRTAELGRINDIETLATQFEAGDLGRDFISSGKSVDDFRSALLKRIGTAKPAAAGDADIGLSDAERGEFKFTRLINALANPTSRSLQKAAAFEFEACQAAADRSGREPDGMMVPTDVLRSKRDLTVGTATAGGHTVATDLLTDSFIDKLDKAMVMARAGATTLNGLVGNIAIPRQTGGGTAYWVGENVATTESAVAFDQVAMAPSTVGTFTDIARKLLLQSSMDIEQFVRNDLALRLALEIDRVCINGSGSGAEPTGVISLSGIGDVAGGTNGLAPTWANIVNIKKEVAKDNAAFGSLGWLLNADTVAKLQTVEKASSTAQFILGDDASKMAGYSVFESNQVPNDLDKGTSTGVCSAILYGNWADVVIGFWGGLDVNVDTSTGSSAGTVRVVTLQDVDVGFRHPESFSTMLDALTT